MILINKRKVYQMCKNLEGLREKTNFCHPGERQDDSLGAGFGPVIIYTHCNFIADPYKCKIPSINWGSFFGFQRL
jgi:hypothetical protein